jgi:ArsR family transcriptional regulator
MGVTKTEFYTAHQIEMAGILKALGHPARLAIIEHLIKVNTCICNDLVNELQLAQPTISQHLKELKNAGLIKGNIEGASICYCINESVFEQVLHFFAQAVENYANPTKKCC